MSKAKALSKLAKEAKDLWDSYNRKGGKNYNKKFEDNKPPKSKAEKPLTEKQGGKLFAEKRKLKEKDPEKYRDLTKSGLTRKKIKPEQGPYDGDAVDRYKNLGLGSSRKKLTKEQQDKLEKQRQKYSEKTGKAGRGEGSYKDGGTPKKKKKTKEQLSQEKLRERIQKGIIDPKMMERQFEYDKRERETLGPKKKKKPPMPRVKPAPKSIDIKEGGLVLKVTKKGPLYKGKKSGNKKT